MPHRTRIRILLLNGVTTARRFPNAFTCVFPLPCLSYIGQWGIVAWRSVVELENNTLVPLIPPTDLGCYASDAEGDWSGGD